MDSPTLRYSIPSRLFHSTVKGVLGDAAFVGGDRQAAGTGSARRAADERVSQHYSGDWD